MTGSQPTPLDIARHAADLGKKDPSDRTLKLLTIGMLLFSGVAAVGHMIHTLYRDIRGKERDNGRGDRHPPASTSPPANADTATEEESQSGKKWSHRPEVAERQPHGDHAQAAHSRSHAVRQH